MFLDPEAKDMLASKRAEILHRLEVGRQRVDEAPPDGGISMDEPQSSGAAHAVNNGHGHDA